MDRAHTWMNEWAKVVDGEPKRYGVKRTFAFIFNSVLLAPYLTGSFSIRYLMQEGAVGKYIIACLEHHALDRVYDREPIQKLAVHTSYNRGRLFEFSR